MTQPEQQARAQIDNLLTAAGWHVCDADKANIHAARGVAIREFPLPGYGFADYLLYVDGKAAGEPPYAQGNLVGVKPGWPLSRLWLRRAGESRQGFARYLLAEG